jgi:hypothetical protein
LSTEVVGRQIPTTALLSLTLLKQNQQGLNSKNNFDIKNER